MIKEKRLREIAGRFPDMRIAVIGDPYLDRYCIGSVERGRISLEAPEVIVEVKENRYSPGAAGNTAANLSKLGIKVELLGVIGTDYNGEIFLSECQARAIGSDHLQRNSRRKTCTYEKFYREAYGNIQQGSRYDTENREENQRITREEEENLLSPITQLLPTLQGVIIVDQGEEEEMGVITSFVREGLVEMAGRSPETIFVADSRRRIGKYRHCIGTPNKFEALNGAGLPPGDLSEKAIQEAGKQLAKNFEKPVYVTVGEKGAILFSPEGKIEKVPTTAAGAPHDITGAGDTFTATVTAALAAGATPVEAAEIGHLGAGVTVKKIGTTGAPTLEELYARLSR